MEKQIERKTVVFRDSLEVIPNIYALKKLGAGHDGRVYRYKGKALKLLKYDINERTTKNLMTFEKALYLKSKLDLKRIVNPNDILLDKDGIYTGYVMDLLEDVTLNEYNGKKIEPGDFTCGSLIQATQELSEDFSQLTENGVVAHDINRGSYIFTPDFMHLCDMDKYDINIGKSIANNENRASLNFVIAKFLYYEIQKNESLDKKQLKILSKWVKKASNSYTFIQNLEQELKQDEKTPIKEYTKHLSSKII